MSNITAVPGLPADLAELTGPVLLGHLFNWGLFGALTVQCYVYYIAFPRDSGYLKSVVGFTFVIELLQTVLATRDAFRQYGTGWGNLLQLNDVGWLWFTIPILDGIISCFVQLFYAWRVYVLSGGNKYVASAIALFAVIQGAFGIYCGIFSKVIAAISDLQRRMYRPTIVWLGGTALCDVLITVSMIYFLRRARNDNGVKRTTTLLTRLIKLTFETGMVCSTFAIIDLSLFLRFQQNNFHLLPAITLCKLYSNSLLVVFNSRLNIVGGRNTPDQDHSVSNMTLSTGTFHNPTVSKIGTRSRPNNTGITVEVSQIQDVDIQLRSMNDTGFDLDLKKDDRGSRDSFEATLHRGKPQGSYV
ncbi:hypothetical protein BXZ70DRAFT_1057387 [Cristinia sonorae]|uniref:DUF6534 domain-containing protein n=1 Tax=Cristinia sonorae TaxID=1940300 RepID=A0A8K0UTE1_9AGAR|nr:hypothetical protein BXZ70DRAFT_1057387 [Cristinia sonorae]